MLGFNPLIAWISSFKRPDPTSRMPFDILISWKLGRRFWIMRRGFKVSKRDMHAGEVYVRNQTKTHRWWRLMFWTDKQKFPNHADWFDEWPVTASSCTPQFVKHPLRCMDAGAFTSGSNKEINLGMVGLVLWWWRRRFAAGGVVWGQLCLLFDD